MRASPAAAIAFAVCVVLAGHTDARADEQPGIETQRSWYGWQTFLADAVLGMGVYYAVDELAGDDAATYATVGTLLVTGPTVHYLNGNPRRAAANLVVRLAPAVMYLVLDGDDDQPTLGVVYAGLFTGP